MGILICSPSARQGGIASVVLFQYILMKVLWGGCPPLVELSYLFFIDGLSGLVAYDAHDATLIVCEVAVVCSVVLPDVLLAILKRLSHSFVVGIILIVEVNVKSFHCVKIKL